MSSAQFSISLTEMRLGLKFSLAFQYRECSDYYLYTSWKMVKRFWGLSALCD